MAGRNVGLYYLIMRKIVGQYTTRHGELRAIYSVANSIFKHKDIELGGKFDIQYKLGNKDAYLSGVLELATEGNRTLFFKTNEGKSIGIPIMSIVKYIRK
jgi:hypothetical protein